MTTRLLPLVEVFAPAFCLAASPSSLSELPRIERAFPLSSSAAEVNDDVDDDDDERDCGCSACDILLLIVVEVNNAADVVNVTKVERDFLN